MEHPEGRSVTPSDHPHLTVREIEDRRRPARGWSRLIIAVLAATGAVILCPSGIELIRHPDVTPVLSTLNVVAGMLFILASVCVAHNGRRMRMIGWMSLSALFTGAVLFGALTWSGLAPDLESSVWFDGGARLFYLPLLVPVLAGVWLWMSDPRRIVVAAEKIEDLTHLRR